MGSLSETAAQIEKNGFAQKVTEPAEQALSVKTGALAPGPAPL